MIEIKSTKDYEKKAKDGKTIYLFCYNKQTDLLDKISEVKKELKIQNLFIFNVNSDKTLKFNLNISETPVLLHIRSNTVVNQYLELNDTNIIVNILLGKRIKQSRSTKLQNKKSTKKVTVYYASNCPWCKLLIKYLQDNNISFKKTNVSTESKIQSLIKKSHLTGIPQTEINGKFIVGFDIKKLDKIFK